MKKNFRLTKIAIQTLSLFILILILEQCKNKDAVPLPHADFTFAMPGAGVLPTVVNFTSTSTNGTTYQWSFGDGNSGSGATASNTYKAAGTYNVRLIVTGAGGTDSITKQVTITQSKPTAGFTFSITDPGNYPTHVSFTNTSAGAASYRWIFNNGDTSNLQNPVDSFFVSKTYSVKLIVTNAIGVDSITQQVTISINKPKSAFTMTIVDVGNYPTHVNFNNTSTAVGPTTYAWNFGNGHTSTAQNPKDSFTTAQNYTVQLIATNAAGSDTSSQTLTIAAFAAPNAAFTFSVLNPMNLPLNIATSNTSTGASSYSWNFGDGTATSTGTQPNHTFTAGGTYTITLTATGPGGSKTATQTINVSPYLLAYKSYQSGTLNLYAWEGKTVMFLMRTPGLDPTTMFKWVKAIDSSYGYYYAATGKFPSLYTGVGYVNNHVTVADVPATCGAACSYIGATGMEMLNTYTDQWYNIVKNGQYDQAMYYECGRNFWLYGNQLAYKTNDPVTTGFAIYMRFMAMDASGLPLAPFNGIPYATWEPQVAGLLNTYTSGSYTWANTLGAGTGVTNTFGAGASDLFASFCMYLTKNYGGQTFVNNIWKNAGARPTANTTQDAVDNFILACCKAANKNLTTLFMTTWKWPMSAAAQTEASQYP